MSTFRRCHLIADRPESAPYPPKAVGTARAFYSAAFAGVSRVTTTCHRGAGMFDLADGEWRRVWVPPDDLFRWPTARQVTADFGASGYRPPVRMVCIHRGYVIRPAAIHAAVSRNLLFWRDHGALCTSLLGAAYRNGKITRRPRITRSAWARPFLHFWRDLEPCKYPEKATISMIVTAMRTLIFNSLTM
jgi:hypothetical protein